MRSNNTMEDAERDQFTLIMVRLGDATTSSEIVAIRNEANEFMHQWKVSWKDVGFRTKMIERKPMFEPGSNEHHTMIMLMSVRESNEFPIKQREFSKLIEDRGKCPRAMSSPEVLKAIRNLMTMGAKFKTEVSDDGCEIEFTYLGGL